MYLQQQRQDQYFEFIGNATSFRPIQANIVALLNAAQPDNPPDSQLASLQELVESLNAGCNLIDSIGSVDTVENAHTVCTEAAFALDIDRAVYRSLWGGAGSPGDSNGGVSESSANQDDVRQQFGRTISATDIALASFIQSARNDLLVDD